jgi:hypothetical protein
MMRRSRVVYLRRQYFYFKFKNGEGQWVERATRTSSYPEALAIRASFLRELEEGRLPNERGKWTLKQATTTTVLLQCR